MAIVLKNANFAKSTLGGDITDVATSLTVASAGDAALFPATGTMRCVIWGGSYAFPSQDITREIITMTFSATVTFSPVVRGREGTSGKAWSTGDNIALVITAGKIDEIEAEITGYLDQSVKQAASPTFVGATISGSTASLPLFTGASKELVSKSVVDTQTALGIQPRALVGDATAGRVIRRLELAIVNGTSATTIKPSTSSEWNGDANAAEDNLGKSGDTGVFDLNADGSGLRIGDAGISGNCVAVLATDIRYNASGVAALLVDGYVSNGIFLSFTNGAAAADLTTLVDTGAIYINITYLTSA